MGCGALCGDVATCDAAVIKQGKIVMDRLVCQLTRNQEMAKLAPFSYFLEAYQRHPNQFFLYTKKQVQKEDKIGQEVLVKWKVLVLGGEKMDKSYRECLGLNSDWTVNYSKCDDNAQASEDSSLIYHEIWKQIEKDIGRTFKAFQPFQPSSQMLEQFSFILKQITNHFPKMGYCQSLNFIVGYLLVLGFSQRDSFEVFVCLATSKRYLLLGMYQQKFPLYDAFFLIFRNALKRMSPALFSHIFDVPDFTHHLWLFKWLSNLFINFLPNEILPYVWDFVIMTGSIGMIIIAICLLQHLEATILGFSDVGDLNDFFNSLKDLDTFNEKVNLHHFISRAYHTELIEKDFDHVELQGGFYGIYVKASFKKGSKSSRSLRVHDELEHKDSDSEIAEKMLKGWRNELVQQRKAFRMNHQKERKGQQDKRDNEDIEVVILQSPIAQQKESIEYPVVFVRNQSRLQKVEYQFNKINEKVEEEDQSVISQSSSHSKLPKPQTKNYDLDELSKFQFEFYAKKRKPTQNNTNQRHQTDNALVKINNFNVGGYNTLSLAGRISVRNQVNYDAISISSKKNSNKSQIKSNNESAKAPTPKNGRLCGCKTKTQQNKCLSYDQNSQLGESKYQFSEKDSVSINNYSHKSQANDADSIRDDKTHRERISTHANHMNNSAFTKPQPTGKTESDSEVVVFPFKKNKRARINLIAAQLPKRDYISKINWEPEQQSIEQLSQLQLPPQSHNKFPHP